MTLDQPDGAIGGLGAVTAAGLIKALEGRRQRLSPGDVLGIRQRWRRLGPRVAPRGARAGVGFGRWRRQTPRALDRLVGDVHNDRPQLVLDQEPIACLVSGGDQAWLRARANLRCPARLLCARRRVATAPE